MTPYMGIAVCAQTAACFGVFLKSRNSEIKNVAVSSAATGLFGITEPAIYGVTLRFKKPFICGCIGGAIGSIVASFFSARYFVYAGLTGFLGYVLGTAVLANILVGFVMKSGGLDTVFILFLAACLISIIFMGLTYKAEQYLSKKN